MNLIPFSTEHLRINAALPFDVVDATGQLLMAKGAVIRDRDQLQQLLAHTLMVDEEQTVEWRRGLAGRIDDLVRRNASLQTIAKASTESPSPARAAAELSLPSEVADMQMKLSLLLRETQPDAAWIARLQAFAIRTRQLVERDTDAMLYLLMQTSTQHYAHYSSHHAFLCAAVVEVCAMQLRWSLPERQALAHAALTMNLSMTALQNRLAQQDTPLDAAQKQRIALHADQSAQMLLDAGVTDPLWLDVVRRHHEDAQPELPLAELTPSLRLARMLRRADVFTAKISPRKSRIGLPAPLAARDACLGANGQPDEIGAATIKALGIYPPGSYVRLASGEIAVVMRRGLRANQPRVASLIGREGQALGVPAPRDTADPKHEVKGAVRVNEVRVRVNHERMLAL